LKGLVSMEATEKKQVLEKVEKIMRGNEPRLATFGKILEELSLLSGFEKAFVYAEGMEGYRNVFSWGAKANPSLDKFKNDFNQNEILQILTAIKEESHLLIGKSTGENPLLQKMVQRHAIMCALFVPIKEGSSIHGFVSFENSGTKVDCDDVPIDALHYYKKAVKLIDLEPLMKELAPSKDIVNRIAETSRSVIYIVDCDTKEIVYANKTAFEKYPDLMIGGICHETLKDEKQDQPCAFCGCGKVRNYSDVFKTQTFNTTLKTWANHSFSKIRSETGKNEVLVVVDDVTNDKLFFEQQGTLEYYDSSLEIPNRKALIRDLTNVLSLKSNKGILLTIDLDSFKIFNNTFGYEYGDMYLKEVSKFMHGMDESFNIYRSGGDEISLLVMNASIEEGKNIARKIQRRFNSEWQIEDIEYKGTVSIGMIAYPKSGTTTDDLLSKVDFCLSDAKTKGKNQLIVYEKTIGDDILRKNQLNEIIFKGIEKNHFTVYYQPIYNITKQKYIKAEALIRLYHKDFGFIPPSDFIPIAEDMGVISSLGFYVLEDVCKKLMTLRMMNTDFECINVNVSTKQLVQKNYVTKVKQILDKYDIPGSMIQFEITESILISSFDIVAETMEQLREFGVTFALDDFGTGYSTLSYLTRLRFDTLKIDRSFITAAEHDYASKIMLKNIINLAKELNMEVVAEGVETDVQLAILSSYRCYNIQGYFFGKPVPASTLLQTFSKKSPDLIPMQTKFDTKTIINTFFSETNSKFVFDLFELISSGMDVYDSLMEALELTGVHLDIPRIYLFEDLGYEVRKQMEWTANTRYKPMTVTENTAIFFNDYGSRFDEYGIATTDKKDMSEKIGKSLSFFRIESIAEGLIVVNGKKMGYIGFCSDDEHTWSKEELSVLYILSKVAGFVIGKGIK